VKLNRNANPDHSSEFSLSVAGRTVESIAIMKRPLTRATAPDVASEFMFRFGMAAVRRDSFRRDEKAGENVTEWVPLSSPLCFYRQNRKKPAEA